MINSELDGYFLNCILDDIINLLEYFKINTVFYFLRGDLGSILVF